MSISQKFYIICLILTNLHFNLFGKEKYPLRYNLKSPNEIITLPKVLHEVSGLTVIDNQNLACIQDENGIIFTYNLQLKKITNEAWFAEDGDYEGIALVGNTMYVLRSDGILFEVENYSSPQRKTKQYSTHILAVNNEGLYYDKENNRLLIASKSNERKGAQYKDMRAVWSFDLKTKKVEPKPAFTLNAVKINSFVANEPTTLNAFSKTQKSKIKFRPAAMAIHPFSKKVFILSALDFSLFIFDNNGNLEHVEHLEPSLFQQAEGIAFLNDGTLYISNEGQDKHPTLLKFNYLQ